MKKAYVIIEYSLQEALAAITAELYPPEREPVPLSQALGRINAATTFADPSETLL